MTIDGYYYPPGSARQMPAQLQVQQSRCEIITDTETFVCDLTSAQLSERLAQLPGSLNFADGSRFDSHDHAALQDLMQPLQSNSGTGLVHGLESRWHWAIAALVLTPVLIWGLFNYGLPLLARPLSYLVPPTLVTALDDQIMAFLDERVLQPSELSNEEQGRIEYLFMHVRPSADYQLLLRKGGRIGANALALPAGRIVVTDELVYLAERDDELLAVFAHEIGHVEQRHALRQIIQSTGVALIMGSLLGDFTWVTDTILVSAPVLLQQLSYSRDFEREADQYALQILPQIGVARACFASILTKIVDSHGMNAEGEDAFSYWSTHPATDERLHNMNITNPEC